MKYKLGRIPSISDFDEYGELDPLRIIEASGSYHEFLLKYESEYDVNLDSVQMEMLEFVSRKFASGKRVHELVMLNLILNDAEDLMQDWEIVMSAKYGVEIDDIVRTNIVNVFTNEFFGIGAARETFKNCIFLT